MRKWQPNSAQASVRRFSRSLLSFFRPMVGRLDFFLPICGVPDFLEDMWIFQKVQDVLSMHDRSFMSPDAKRNSFSSREIMITHDDHR